MSGDAKDDSMNLRASPYAGKQAQWGDTRIWWFIILAKGRVHIEMMPEGWTQNGEGQAKLIALLPRILSGMLGRKQEHPSVVFTDRGPGFYHPSQGSIFPEYANALEEHGFTAWAGDHAKWQPPDIADILLHETAVSWVRQYLKTHPINWGINQARNIQRCGELLADAADYINTYHDVEGLCHELPERLKELRDEAGERLSK